MFDDYVEHSIDDSKTHNMVPLPRLQYEGFEPSPYGGNDARAEVEQGQEAGTEANPPTAPVFELGRVQYAFPAPLISFVVSSDMLAMGLSSNLLVLIELSHADQVIKIPIPRKPTEMTIHKLFMDPSGRHIIITSIQGENWYLFRTWKKPRQLKGFKMVIESIAWNKSALLSSSHSTSTREILIGARNGTIFEAVLDAEEDFFKSQERYLQSVFSLPERHPITGIKFDYFPPSDPKTALVLVTTPTRIYQFAGPIDKKSDDSGRVFTVLFASYRETAPKILELPGNLQHSELQFYTPNPDQALSLPKRMAWMTGPGIYHGFLNVETDSEDHIDGAALLPYPNTIGSDVPEIPISLSLTEFHFILLYKDRIVGICNLDDKMTYEETLPIKANETVLGLAADPVRRTYWVYTNQSLFELVVGNEDRDVWKIYLEKAQFDVALRYSKTARQRDQILLAQANTLFSAGQYFPAAQCYAHCSATFEEVALKFLDVGERDSLRSYLISRLERTRKTDITQRMVLATWLIEFYLSKCNELDDIVASESVSHDVDNLQAERTIVEGDLRQFFETYRNNLNKETVYELIQGHGRTDMYLYYATTIGDFERVIEHWILEEEWLKAIEIISRQSDLELYYRFGPVLMHQVPKETVDSWLRQTSLDTLRLIPSLLQLQHSVRDPLSPNHAIRYLNHVIFEQNNTSPTIHNLLITFYVSPTSSRSYTPSTDDDGPLLRFLSTAPTDPLTGKPYYDLDYALRICKLAGRTQPCVHIYSKMGLWENSVDLALEKGDLELAKTNADMPEDDQPLRKKLWLKIARYVVQDKKDIKSAMRFLENADLLKIEDILPFFPDFVVIDDFKEEIAHALEGYSAQIDTLKGEMDEATRTAESIKQDIAALKNRFITINANEQCSTCSTPLLTRQFYVFPCHHTFHADCLIGLAKEHLPAHALRRIITLQNELMKDAPSKGRLNVTKPTLIVNAPSGRQPTTQRTLLSANFGAIANPLQNSAKAANLLGRSVISAGDRLRDLIIPDALAAIVSAPNWLPGIGGNHQATGNEKVGGKKLEKLKAELDDVLSSSCPLCESVVAGLDKPFVMEGEVNTSWTL
ncbi:DigA protein [Crassisporium funariophilum]|nr:DigA protein [Crassisporium funariophilum]